MSLPVLVAEPSPPVAAALRGWLTGAGFDVACVGRADEALASAGAHLPVLLVVSGAGGLDGEALCRAARERWPALPVLLLLPPDAADAEARAEACGADGCVVGPLKRGTVVSFARALVQLGSARAEAGQGAALSLEDVGGQEAGWDLGPQEAPAPQAAHEAPLAEPDADLAFFKRLLLLEVKRSRRYRYPIAVLLVALDGAAALGEAEAAAALAEAQTRVRSGVRDIDVVAGVGERRLAVFLPHTPWDGARVVAERLCGALRGLALGPGAPPEAGASVGLAVYEPARDGTAASLGSLLKDAGAALQRAQDAGGGRVEAAGRPKRDRISLG